MDTMKREFLFKGKRADNGEWVYGYLVKDPKENYRIYCQPFSEASSNTYHIVLPETVCQFTGLTDKNGIKIFEGDILNYGFKSHDLVEFSFHKVSSPSQGGSDEYEYYGYNNLSPYRGDYKKSTVIGSIHDNPEPINK